MKTIIESFRIRSLEPLCHTTPEQREWFLGAAGYNLVLIEAGNILIDLFADSGAGTISTEQRAAMMRGDESYAGGESFFRLKAAVEELTGFRHVTPTQPGRAAQRIPVHVRGRPAGYHGQP